MVLDVLDKILGATVVAGGASGGIAWTPTVQHWFEQRCINTHIVSCSGDFPGVTSICSECADAGNLAVQLPVGGAVLAAIVFGIKFFAALEGSGI